MKYVYGRKKEKGRERERQGEEETERERDSWITNCPKKKEEIVRYNLLVRWL